MMREAVLRAQQGFAPPHTAIECRPRPLARCASKTAATVRANKLVEQLPEALDLLARSLQAGLGLNEAFRTVAEEMPLPVAGEARKRAL